jgi:hypothetical protein
VAGTPGHMLRQFLIFLSIGDSGTHGKRLKDMYDTVGQPNSRTHARHSVVAMVDGAIRCNTFLCHTYCRCHGGTTLAVVPFYIQIGIAVAVVGPCHEWLPFCSTSIYAIQACFGDAALLPSRNVIR